MPSFLAIINIPKWEMLPVPVKEKLRAPGFERAKVTNSGIDLIPSSRIDDQQIGHLSNFRNRCVLFSRIKPEVRFQKIGKA